MYLRFADFDEFNFTSSETFKEDIIETLDRNKPDIEAIKNKNLDWKSDECFDFLLRDLTWTPFASLWNKIMESAVNEEDAKQPLRKGIILLTMVSAHEEDIPNAIANLVSRNGNRLADLFDEGATELERSILRVNMVIEDRRQTN